MEHGREGEEELREKRTNQTGDKHGGWRMKRALVCGAGGFIGGDPENFGLRIADLRCCCGIAVVHRLSSGLAAVRGRQMTPILPDEGSDVGTFSWHAWDGGVK